MFFYFKFSINFSKKKEKKGKSSDPPAHSVTAELYGSLRQSSREHFSFRQLHPHTNTHSHSLVTLHKFNYNPQ